MVSLHVSHRRMSGASARSSVDESRSDGAEDESQVVEPDQGNVLSHIIANLRPGADLSRVVLPTFILEPRSMLERITNFMAHPETLLPMSEIDDPVDRFVSVVKFYLSGWHIKPPGVKKPLNPVLGETFTCYWEFPDNTKGYYISEQTSHHPPKSSYFYMAPEHHIRIDGCLKPRSKFLGNSAASLMEGIALLRFLNRGESPKGETYILTQPNMYARGILFGKMKYELGDHSFVRCPELGLSADIEFKVKGYFTGGYNSIGGSIKDDKTGQVLYELSGLWNGEMWIKDVKTGKKDLLFNATRAKHTPPLSRPIEEQEDRESQKLWYTTAQAVIARNHDVATDEKTKIEDTQREEAARRAADGVEWVPRIFRAVRSGPGGSEQGEEDLDWILNANIDGATPEKQVEQILAITPILPGQQPVQRNRIPKRSESRSSMNQVNSNENQAPPQTIPSQPSPIEEADLINFSEDASSSPIPPVAQNSIPPQDQASTTAANQNIPSQSPLQSQTPNSTTAEAGRPKPVYLPTDLHVAQTENGGQRQKELEEKLEETSITPPKGSALTDVERDLKREEANKAKQPSSLRKEVSRGEESDDEFLDAEG